MISLVAAEWLIKAIYGHGPDVARVAPSAAVLVWGTSVLAVLPVGVLGSAGVLATVWGYFIGAGVRLLSCMGVYWWLTTEPSPLPARPLAVALGVTYVWLLFVEMAMVGRYLWAKDFLYRTAGAGGATCWVSSDTTEVAT